jgi:hypothetical protein
MTVIPGLREPTAIRPDRPVVLTEREQLKLAQAMHYLAMGDDLEARRLASRLLYGDSYDNPTDELIRTTLEKRALESAVRRLNGRIADLDQQVVEELIERGDTGGKHAGTGASYRVGSKLYARLVVDVNGMPRDQAEALRAGVKGAAGHVLSEVGLGDFVRPDFNLNTLSAYFREQIKEYRETQLALPEHERVPKAASEFLPEGLRGLIELDDTPTITVTKSR